MQNNPKGNALIISNGAHVAEVNSSTDNTMDGEEIVCKADPLTLKDKAGLVFVVFILLLLDGMSRIKLLK